MKNFLKPFIWVISWLLLLSWVFAMVQWNNSKLELSQKSMVFTDDGTVWWDMVAWINTGWDSIFYWPLLDGEWNPFLTGYTETDPAFTANSVIYTIFLKWYRGILNYKVPTMSLTMKQSLSIRFWCSTNTVGKPLIMKPLFWDL